MSDPLWQPSSDRLAASHLTRFMRVVSQETGRSFAKYADLHRWSIKEAPAFWRAVWDYCGVIGDPGARLAIDRDRMPGARFLPDARLNFAENLLRYADAAPSTPDAEGHTPEPRVDGDADAIVAMTEDGVERRLTFAELAAAVRQAAAALRADGVRAGDRVAGLVANVPEAVIASLAAASIGAIWSSCSPDFGADSVVDRFGQIAPRVLIAVDGYRYGGKTFDCLPAIRAVRARVPSIARVVIVRLAGAGVPGDVDDAWIEWREWTRRESPAHVPLERFPFDQPLYILYSSGTTGVPKCIVHRTGGTLLQHLKEHQLQSDIRAGDRVFYFTTCGWMMWNWLVTALATGATLVLYDGSPFFPDGRRLFDLVDRAGISFFGVSAKFLDAVRKAGIAPRRTHDLSTLRTIASTGSPLAPDAFDFVYDAVKPDVHLASISGGTDIIGCFVLGNPNGPVWRGEIQAAGLGMDVHVFDPNGASIVGAPGELVCARPFPSMPLGFWNDEGGRRYHAAYFERFPGVWHHGDWASRTEHGGFIIYGRSDTTLNPGGVRIGTAEIYRQVEAFPEIVESVAVGQRWQGDERIVLFVRVAPGHVLDDDLRARIRERLRTHASPRHVPARILDVADIPRTRSGKIVEAAVRDAVHGRPIANRDALANPDALDLYRDRPELDS